MKILKSKSISIVIFLFFTLSSTYVHALIEEKKYWLAMNVQRSLDAEKKWLVSLYSQWRFIKRDHPLESAFVETALGYQISHNKSVWFGYRLLKHISRPPTFQMNHLFQQFLYTKKLNFCSIMTRSRLEQGYRSNQKQLSFRFRQRVAIEFSRQFIECIYPLIYDEIFLLLNKTNYTPHKFPGENRLFFGFNYYQQKNIWWEIGYMLQYRAHLPLSKSKEARLDHVLMVTFNSI